MQIDFAKFKKTQSKHGQYSGRKYLCVLIEKECTDAELQKINSVASVYNTHLLCKEFLLSVADSQKK
jgi:hypothetical protein